MAQKSWNARPMGILNVECTMKGRPTLPSNRGLERLKDPKRQGTPTVPALSAPRLGNGF